MARGVRKTILEKLNEELEATQEAIEQYKTCLDTLKEKKRSLQEQIELEELKGLSVFLKEQNISVEDLRELVQSQTVSQEQSA